MLASRPLDAVWVRRPNVGTVHCPMRVGKGSDMFLRKPSFRIQQFANILMLFLPLSTIPKYGPSDMFLGSDGKKKKKVKCLIYHGNTKKLWEVSTHFQVVQNCLCGNCHLPKYPPCILCCTQTMISDKCGSQVYNPFAAHCGS